MHCHDCGLEIAAATNFCRHCGVRQAPAASYTQANATSAALAQPSVEHAGDIGVTDPQSPLQAGVSGMEALLAGEPPLNVDVPPADAHAVTDFEAQAPSSFRVRPIVFVAGLVAAVTIVIGVGAFFALSHRAGGGDQGEILARTGDGSGTRSADGDLPQTRISSADSTRRAAIAAAIAADARQIEDERGKAKARKPQIQQKSARQSMPEGVKKTTGEKKPEDNPRAAVRAESPQREQEPRRRESGAQAADARTRVADPKAPQATPKPVAQNLAASGTPKLQAAARVEHSNQPVCADSSNLFSREICLWRACERPEYRQTADCARFTRSAN